MQTGTQYADFSNNLYTLVSVYLSNYKAYLSELQYDELTAQLTSLDDKQISSDTAVIGQGVLFVDVDPQRSTGHDYLKYSDSGFRWASISDVAAEDWSTSMTNVIPGDLVKGKKLAVLVNTVRSNAWIPWKPATDEDASIFADKSVQKWAINKGYVNTVERMSDIAEGSWYNCNLGSLPTPAEQVKVPVRDKDSKLADPYAKQIVTDSGIKSHLYRRAVTAVTFGKPGQSRYSDAYLGFSSPAALSDVVSVGVRYNKNTATSETIQNGMELTDAAKQWKVEWRTDSGFIHEEVDASALRATAVNGVRNTISMFYFDDLGGLYCGGQIAMDRVLTNQDRTSALTRNAVTGIINYTDPLS